MKYFVTGGAGFIASHLIDRLLQNQDNQVVAYDNLYRGKLDNLDQHKYNPNFEFVYEDIRNYNFLEEEMHGSDVVYHLAAQSNVVGGQEDKDYCFSTNVGGTDLVLHAAWLNKVKTVIFSSSREVYGNNICAKEKDGFSINNTYAKSKALAEESCKEYQNDVNINILRLSNVYGLRDFDRVIPLWMKEFENDGEITIYGGQQIIDFVYIDLVVDALIKARNLKNETINVGSGKGTSLQMLLKRLEFLYGKKIKTNYVPSRDFETMGYTANIDKMKKLLDINPPKDPLYGLDYMIRGNIQ